MRSRSLLLYRTSRCLSFYATLFYPTIPTLPTYLLDFNRARQTRKYLEDLDLHTPNGRWARCMGCQDSGCESRIFDFYSRIRLLSRGGWGKGRGGEFEGVMRIKECEWKTFHKLEISFRWSCIVGSIHILYNTLRYSRTYQFSLYC